MTNRIGIIAENNSDVEVIKEILKKYFNENTYAVKKYIGKGCGKLKQKCTAWAINLRRSGCNHIIVFHDLDENDEHSLRCSLEEKINITENNNSLVVIPIKEMEAWLLTDINAIKSAFNLQKVNKPIRNCETIDSPKEFLRDIVWKTGKKRYLNTVHNVKIASFISKEKFMQCKSYHIFDKYLNEDILI